MIGQKVTLDIVDIGFNGEGIAKLNDKTVFVENVLVGEKVNAIVTKVKKNLVFAKVFKILVPSPIRRTPPCAVFYKCGGCDIQHIEYDEQLKIKEKEVYNTLKKQLSDIPFKVEAIVRSASELGYRNKAQLPIGFENGKVVVGFYEKNSNDIVKITRCPLHEEWLDQIINAFLKFANECKISVYDKNTGSGLLRHLVCRKVNNEVSIVVVINGTVLPYYEKFIELLNNHLPLNFSLFMSVNTTNTNVILGDSGGFKLLKGNDRIITNVLGLTVSISPLSFFQINDYIAKKIYDAVIDEVAGQNNVVIDAYSGAGLLTALMGKVAFKSFGIEIVKEAIDDANNLVKENGLNNIKNICGDVKNILPSLVKQCKQAYKDKNIIIILDPPRKGCDEEVLKTVLKADCNKIIYISCNPATLARDLALLTKDNLYEISLIRPYDMFPQTRHVETLVCMKRKNI